MITPYEYIIEVSKSHQDEITLAKGLKLSIDTKFNQGLYVNRIGTVIARPLLVKANITEGEQVVIDKNMITYDIHGDTFINKSMNLIDAEKGWYRVPPELIYLHRETEQDEWQCQEPFLFVSPIKEEKIETESGLSFTEDGYKGNRELFGKIKYLNNEAKKFGLKQGDTIFYKKDREYEFYLDGETLYHMDNSDVLALVN